MTGLGHNGGPSLEGGTSWRKVAWSKARKGLMGERLPIEVIRSRISRAKELGLNYKTYASIRASTGRDVIGFLFSSNALQVLRKGDAMPVRYADKLAQVKSRRLAAAHRPIDPSIFDAIAEIDWAGRAPAPLAKWSELSASLGALLGTLPRDGVVLVSEAPFEKEWVEAGRLAGRLDAAHYFGE